MDDELFYRILGREAGDFDLSAQHAVRSSGRSVQGRSKLTQQLLTMSKIRDPVFDQDRGQALDVLYRRFQERRDLMETRQKRIEPGRIPRLEKAPYA